MTNENTWPVEIEQYEKKIYDLKQLIEISKGLNSTLEYNTLIDSILLICMGQMQLLKAGIFLKKGIGYEDYVFHRSFKGFEIEQGFNYEIDADSPTIQYISVKNKCYDLEELRKNKNVSSDSAFRTLEKLSPLVIVPLFSRKELNGIILLGDRINEAEFSQVEKDYLLDIASLAGIAIQNAFLFEMATTDMMTKLKIHHYFHTSLADEIARSCKTGRPLSLIMADIDHFKNFNDAHGHVAGDVVLKRVASLIKENTRQMDISARYGGEEFAIILPSTDINEALIVAERFRHSVEKEVMLYGGEEMGVTISLGITQYDSEMDDGGQSLVERADKALYISKAGGRNQVSFV